MKILKIFNLKKRIRLFKSQVKSKKSQEKLCVKKEEKPLPDIANHL